MLVLLFITPVFERLTYNATAAIILSSVFGLFEISEALHLFRVHFLDFLVWSAAFLGTIFAGVEIGLGIAIGLAIFLVVYRSAFPHIAVLGQLPETGAHLIGERWHILVSRICKLCSARAQPTIAARARTASGRRLPTTQNNGS